jgi:hypothetical protein
MTDHITLKFRRAIKARKGSNNVKRLTNKKVKQGEKGAKGRKCKME